MADGSGRGYGSLSPGIPIDNTLPQHCPSSSSHGQVYGTPAGAQANAFAYMRDKNIMLWLFQESTAGGPKSGTFYGGKTRVV